MQTYRVTASIQRDGHTVVCDDYCVLGDAYGVTYTTRAAAEQAAQDLRDSLDEFPDLDPSTEFEAVEAEDLDMAAVAGMDA